MIAEHAQVRAEPKPQSFDQLNDHFRSGSPVYREMELLILGQKHLDVIFASCSKMVGKVVLERTDLLWVNIGHSHFRSGSLHNHPNVAEVVEARTGHIGNPRRARRRDLYRV